MSFQGSLKELPLADIVQLVAVSGKTGMFSLTRGSERGAVYIQNGQITHATVNDIQGEDAIYSLALWNDGQFQFSPGLEGDARTITRSNTNLLMEAARRSDEWKILSKKIPTTDAVPQLVCREGLSEPVTLTPMEWLVVTNTDGARSIEEIARAARVSAFDVAKTLYGLITSDLVEIRTKAEAARAAAASAAVAAPAAPAAAAAGPVVTTHSGVFNAVTRGDERRSLQILCTKVKQEAESAALAPGDPAIDRLYRAALGEVDKGRGLDVVRELIRSLEQTVAALRGREASLAFREKMAPLL
ncbi:MAG: DUF4388 domain-containing protein [Thermoanaerobaculia bacterium]